MLQLLQLGKVLLFFRHELLVLRTQHFHFSHQHFPLGLR